MCTLDDGGTSRRLDDVFDNRTKLSIAKRYGRYQMFSATTQNTLDVKRYARGSFDGGVDSRSLDGSVPREPCHSRTSVIEILVML